jgi:ERCC4-related helicase
MDSPRDYQVSLCQQALREDVIIVLPTGSGTLTRVSSHISVTIIY